MYVHPSDGRTRIRVNSTQLKYILTPFILLVNKFCKVPKESKWDEYLLTQFDAELDYELAMELMAIKFTSREIPQDREFMFEFQLKCDIWKNFDRKKVRLEYMLVKHARFILANAATMIRDPLQRGALRNFDEDSRIPTPLSR